MPTDFSGGKKKKTRDITSKKELLQEIIRVALCYCRVYFEIPVRLHVCQRSMQGRMNKQIGMN
jgi:hypothetical protein